MEISDMPTCELYLRGHELISFNVPCFKFAHMFVICHLPFNTFCKIKNAVDYG